MAYFAEGEVAIVTGGAKGIGLSATEIFLREGARVAIFDLDEEAGAAAAGKYRKSCSFYPVDVSQSGAVEEAVSQVVSHFGRLDYLVNNVGILHYANAMTCTEEDWDRIMNVNLKSYFLCAKYALPHLIQREAAVIINVASAQSFVSSGNMVHYTTAKSALLGFTRSLAIDFGPKVRALAVCPGTVDTPMAWKAWTEAGDAEGLYQESARMHVLQRIAKAEEVGELIVYLCSGRSAFMTGQAIRIDGGLGISVAGSPRE